MLRGFLEKPPRWMDKEHTDMFQRSTEIELQMRDDILASVPQHTGYADLFIKQRDYENEQFDCSYHSTQGSIPDVMDESTSSIPFNHEFQQQFTSFNSADPPSTRRETIFELKHKSPLRCAGSYFLLWPLFLVGEMGLGTEGTKAWVIGRLRRVGDTMGIMQAHALATILEKGEEIRAWDVDGVPIRHESLEMRYRKDESRKVQGIYEISESLEEVQATGTEGNDEDLFGNREPLWPHPAPLAQKLQELGANMPEVMGNRSQLEIAMSAKIGAPHMLIDDETWMYDGCTFEDTDIGIEMAYEFQNSNPDMIFPSTWPIGAQQEL